AAGVGTVIAPSGSWVCSADLARCSDDSGVFRRAGCTGVVYYCAPGWASKFGSSYFPPEIRARDVSRVGAEVSECGLFWTHVGNVCPVDLAAHVFVSR